MLSTEADSQEVKESCRKKNTTGLQGTMYHFKKKKKKGTNMKQMPASVPRVEKKEQTLGSAEGSNLDIQSPEFYHGDMTLRKTALAFSGILNLAHSYSNCCF